jgi:hypothetical protein
MTTKVNQPGGTTASAEAAAVARVEVGKLREAFKLTAVQAFALYELLARTATGAVESICLQHKITNVRLVAVRRLRGGVTERCRLGHHIMYAYDLSCFSQQAVDGEQIVTLGSTCASHVLNLPAPVARAIESIARWVKRIEDRELPHMLGVRVEQLQCAGVPDDQIGERIISDYRATAEYEEVMRGVRLIKGRELEAAQPATGQRRRDFNLARLCHAIRTCEVCDGADLPIAPTIVKRIRLAVRRLEEVDKRAAARAPHQATAAQQPAPVITYVTPVTAQPAVAPANNTSQLLAPGKGGAQLDLFF